MVAPRICCCWQQTYFRTRPHVNLSSPSPSSFLRAALSTSYSSVVEESLSFESKKKLVVDFLSGLMEKENIDVKRQQQKADGGALTGFSPVSSTRIFWKSRKRSASGRNLDMNEETANKNPTKQEETPNEEMEVQPIPEPVLSERRKALFEPLEPSNGLKRSAESLLPPPDFDSANYPKGWLIGKKRKLVNVDVVESMRRIAVQEINRKDREIDGLNEQLEGDAQCLEHLQLQLLQERSKRSEVERENAMLQDQINMLMNVLQENETMGDEGPDDEP